MFYILDRRSWAYFFLLHAPLRRNQIPGVRQHVGICSEAILRLNGYLYVA